MNSKKIGNFIFERRKELDLTQQQLADLLGVTNKAISKWETGEGYPDITAIPKLSHALGISTDDFFAGEKIRCLSKCNDITEYECKSNSNSDSFNKYEACNIIMTQLQDIGKKIITYLPYTLYIVIVYYLFSYNIRESFIEWIVAWVLVAVPFLNIIIGGFYTKKCGLSIAFCLISGLAIVPLLMMFGGNRGTVDIIIIVCGYILSTFVGSLLFLILKSKYSIVKKSKSHYSGFDITDNSIES